MNDTARTPPLDQSYYRAPYTAALARFFRKYATFRGRASRSEYWWWMVTSWLVAVILNTASGLVTGNWNVDTFRYILALSFHADLFAWAGVLFSLATVIPALAVTWRRLHDTNHRGGWFFIAFIPVLGWIALLVLTLTRPNTDGVRFDTD
ncbi:hypothetical protein ALI44B_01130 [Leifsonia sp. ALI-44-B]|uniref:DUF805 domain-containing protein n=1 Tax=Leifsonia sp. ALI-44-B TaxID=1933776 RepID=UPI00097BDFF8|nr:DUF805 domain-containing protein [Leifsonia sp. ALI-44-B]ONI65326.1 hypothetical protein ALI44B_01130 [Leifsonia sp. ALI-44-B]